MRTLRHLLCAALFGALLALAAFAADEAKKNYDIPAGDAASALKQFSLISGRETLFAAETVRGINTPSVKGELSAQEALDALLQGTGLHAATDAKTGAISIRRDLPGESKNAASRPVDAQQARGVVKDGVLQLDTFEVTASKPGLNNVGVIKRNEDATFAHEVLTRVDIERMGVTNIEDLIMRINGVSNSQNGLQTSVGNSTSIAGAPNRLSTVSLRGFSDAQTVVLINGRRVSRSPLTNGTMGATNMSRIPTAAIDRIEVMSQSSSALYGAGAIGGAINIILRKDYVGREATFRFGTSTGGGATEYGATYQQGLSFNNGKTTGTVIMDVLRREPLYQRQRGYIDRLFQRTPPTEPVFGSLLGAYFGGTVGVVFSQDGVTPLGIPGNPTATYAVVPTGQNGLSLTPASFSSTAGQLPQTRRLDDSILRTPSDRLTFNLQTEHEFIKDRLIAYFDMDVVRELTDIVYPASSRTMRYSATSPLNPFRTGVTPGFVGVPVSLYFDTPDLGSGSQYQLRNSARVVMGVRGRAFESWDWAFDVSGDYVRSYSNSGFPGDFVTVLLNSSRTAAENLQNTVYVPWKDMTAFPATPDNIATYHTGTRVTSNYNKSSRSNFRVNGPVWDLPAGPLLTSVQGEAIADYNQNRSRSTQPAEANRLIPQTDRGQIIQFNGRTTFLAGAEFVAPIISDQWRPRYFPVKSLQVDVAQSMEWANETADKQTYAYGAKLGLNRHFTFRYSLSNGFYPPDIFDRYATRTLTTRNPNLTSALDPRRGNARIAYVYQATSGGNPDLVPEESDAKNHGIIFTPQWGKLKGLRIGLDFWEITKVNRIEFPNDQAILNFEDSYPGRVTREALTPTDQALGYTGGVITHIDVTRVNIGREFTRGYDWQVDYKYPTQQWGNFEFRSSGTHTDVWNRRQLAGAPTVEYSDTDQAPLRFRGRASLFWDKDRFLVGLTANHNSWFLTRNTRPSQLYPTASGYDGDKIAASTTYDLQLQYRIPVSSGDRGWRNLLQGTEWTLTCLNIFDRMPPYQTTTSGYSHFDDPRQRFILLQVRKTL